MIRPKQGVMPIINHQEKCTACGLCAIDCPTGALTVLQNDQEDTYQLFFRQDNCNACGICKKSCPENCLQLELVIEQDKIDREGVVIFKDQISRCTGCGIPLFPQAMINHLKTKIFPTARSAWPFDLCPSCKIKNQFGMEMVITPRDK